MGKGRTGYFEGPAQSLRPQKVRHCQTQIPARDDLDPGGHPPVPQRDDPLSAPCLTRILHERL